MAINRKLTAFVRMALVAGAFVATEQALAFGQQWRPSEIPVGPGQVRAYAVVAPGATFRPYGVQPRQAQRSAAVAPRLPHPVNRWPGGQHWGGQVSAPAPAQHYPPAAGFYPAPLPAAAMPSPIWVQYASVPPVGWNQPPAPYFARQFAWRPADQPWSAPPGAPAYRTPVSPRTLGFRPAQEISPPGYGSWRPALSAAQPHALRGTAYTAVQPMFRSMPAAVPVAQVAGPVYRAADRWHGGAPSVRDARIAFRPVAYGRSLASRASDVEQRPGSGLAQQLPGWVTTFQETDQSTNCGWCSGS